MPPPVPEPPNRIVPCPPLINRRDLLRAAFLAGTVKGFGPAFSFAQSISAGLTPAAHGEDGSKYLTDPKWKAVFLSDHQNQTLIALSDVIIPDTETPGAKRALVNRFLDLLLSVEPAHVQAQFVDDLAFIDSESQSQLGKNFLDLNVDDQIWLLTAWAYPGQSSTWTEEARPNPGQGHFDRLKALIAGAYYGSEIGQRELGWDGEFTHGPYEGCDHQPETHS